MELVLWVHPRPYSPVQWTLGLLGMVLLSDWTSKLLSGWSLILSGSLDPSSKELTDLGTGKVARPSHM